MDGKKYRTEDDISRRNAVHRRDSMSKPEKAESDEPRAFPDRDPDKKKTGEF